MSREIKFRGFLKDIDVIGIGVPHTGHFVIGDLVQGTEYDYIVGGMLEANEEYSVLEWWQAIQKGTADQFTGLKDMNGRDIYEGDIVCVSDVYGDMLYVDVVIWGGNDDYPAFDLKNHAVEYDSNALSSIFNGGCEIIKVIGNIHNNPELLEADE